MSTLTVKDCIGYLKYVLTELIPIAKYTDMHVMVNKIIILKDYVNLINNINLSMGTKKMGNFKPILNKQRTKYRGTLYSGNFLKLNYFFFSS